jgi:hypothetical protein
MLPFLSPRSPNSMLSLCILPKVVSALFTTLNWGGETMFVLSMFNNFVILAGMVSRVLSKIVARLLVKISSRDDLDLVKLMLRSP